jgi:DNA-binding transcriptional LysR family regulator
MRHCDHPFRTIVITRFAHGDHLEATLGAHRPAASQEADMATERLPMRQIREILRQKLVLGRSHRDIARSVGKSAGAVGSTTKRTELSKLSASVESELSSGELRVVLEPYAPEVPGLFLCFPSRAQVSPAFKAFVDVARQVASEPKLAK